MQVTASNPTAKESWDESRLHEYAVAPLDLTQHQGIGMFVHGDGSGGTLVVRVVCGSTARDYAVPLDFKGKQWVEVPNSEQGLRVRNWGPVGKGAALWAGINYSQVIGVAVGVGYLPPHASSNVTVIGLRALSEIQESLVDPRITVGDQVVQAKGTLRAYDMFTLDPNGTFTVYDRDWHLVSSSPAGAFHPTHLSTFEMTSAVAAQPLWLEVGVSGATETVPNPGAQHP